MSDESFAVNDLFSVKGRVALVTGGGSGLGLTMARALSQNGARVYIASRRKERLDEVVAKYGANVPNGGSIHALPMDVTDKASIKAAVDQIAAKEDRLDVLINNSGATAKRAALDEGEHDNTKQDVDPDRAAELMLGQDFKDWDDNLRVNVTSCYFVTAACLPLLAKSAKAVRPFYPVVLNIASISGHTKLTQQGQICYNSGKAATLQISQQLAQELSRQSLAIRVNSISPGYFLSEMTPKPDAKAKEYGAALQRSGHPREMAQLVISLIVNEYMTGTDSVIDGGYLLANP